MPLERLYYAYDTVMMTPVDSEAREASSLKGWSFRATMFILFFYSIHPYTDICMIDYKNELNAAQYEAVTTLEGPVLVIAGAGSGKTRTIVYRLAHLVESGVPASSILLLTFTRKAAQEMLMRANTLLTGNESSPAYGGAPLSLALAAVQGGTFHSFAFSILRLFQPEGYSSPRLTVMDSHDMTSALSHCRTEMKIGKGDRSFPKNQTLLGLLSKSRNKEVSLEELLHTEAQHLLPHLDDIEALGAGYSLFKREKNLLDYDDLLFVLEETLRTNPHALAYCHDRFRYIMVDEYQDTNPVQARIAALLAGGAHLPAPNRGVSTAHKGFSTLRTTENSGSAEATHQLLPPPSQENAPTNDIQPAGNIMVVGDDAQSIYAFRGADVNNILRFPDFFPGTKIIKLEENYRSSQPILDLANSVLQNATQGYAKHLFTTKKGGLKPNILRPLTDKSQAAIIVGRIAELRHKYPANEIAVLFRSGFHSYNLELQLNKLGIRFRKFGGIRYAEAAHIKDIMSFVRLVLNPLDFTAFSRVASFCKGVGPKTTLKIYEQLTTRDAKLTVSLKKHAQLADDLQFINVLQQTKQNPSALLGSVVDHFQSRLTTLYPDDHPRRLQDLEQLIVIASTYDDLDLLIADLSLDDPLQEEEVHNTIVLSTIHSAKGLEWDAVIILDLVEERFPSRKSMVREDDFEEERRLMYVACTRAKEHLDLFVPATMYDRGSGGSMPTIPSPFVRELPSENYTEWYENYTGGLSCQSSRQQPTRREVALSPQRALTPRNTKTTPSSVPQAYSEVTESTIDEPKNPKTRPEDCGYCRHRLFGRGKIVQHLGSDKYRVNFPGFGLKVIMAAYLTLED